jgi:hypothetical protein
LWFYFATEKEIKRDVGGIKSLLCQKVANRLATNIPTNYGKEKQDWFRTVSRIALGVDFFLLYKGY